MADNLAYKDTVAVIKDFKDFVNGNLSGITGSPVVDPLSDSGISRGSGTYIAAYEDETLTSNFPKITFETVEIGRERIGGGKYLYRERHRHEFAIKYTCMKQNTWTYNSIEYKGKQQCIKYLQYLGSKIKAYSGSFSVNEIVVGPPSNPRELSNVETVALVANLNPFGASSVVQCLAVTLISTKYLIHGIPSDGAAFW